MILPVYYISTPEIDDPVKRDADELAKVLAERQYVDWRELRFEPLTAPIVRRALAQLAGRLRDSFWQSESLLTPSVPSARRSTREAPTGTVAVDTVDIGTFDDARQLIFEYLQSQFAAAYFEIFVEHVVNREEGLRTLWNSADRRFSSIIKEPSGEYVSQAAVCYGEGLPLWIVGAEKEALRTATNCRDLWSGVTGLPPYRPPVDEPLLYTSVLVPIRRSNDRKLGVMNVQSSTYHDIADFDRQELVVLADAVGVLYDAYEMHEVRERRRRDALKFLRRIKDTSSS